MYKTEVLKSVGFNLIQVNYSVSHIRILFKILKERKLCSNISHSNIPSFEDHIKFVKSMPYRYWFLVLKEKEYLGAFYITKNNEISIKLINDSDAIFKEILHIIFKNFKPLSAIPSKRNSKFIINLSPNDKFYNKLLNRIGAEKIQETYRFNI